MVYLNAHIKITTFKLSKPCFTCLLMERFPHIFISKRCLSSVLFYLDKIRKAMRDANVLFQTWKSTWSLNNITKKLVFFVRLILYEQNGVFVKTICFVIFVDAISCLNRKNLIHAHGIYCLFFVPNFDSFHLFIIQLFLPKHNINKISLAYVINIKINKKT